MNKSILIIGLLLMINVLIPEHFAAAATNNVAKPTVESIQKQLEETQNMLEKNETMYQEKINELLLQREKDIAGSLYNFATLFVIVITFFVTVAGVIIGGLIKRISKHQKKIDLVLNSQEFDMKVLEIEEKLVDLRMRERKKLKKQVIKEFEYIEKNTEDKIKLINMFKQKGKIPGLEKLLELHEFEYLRSSVEEAIEAFWRINETELKKEDDDEEDTVNPEEEMESWLIELEALSLEVEKLFNTLN